MRILNICTSGPYTDGFSYQDNLLTKYMVKNGHEVYIVASPLIYDEMGQRKEVEVPTEYVNIDGVLVIRLPYRKPYKYGQRMRKMKGFPETLLRINPDIIFFHNPQSVDAKIVCKYLKKHPSVKLFVDCHSDFSNSARNWFSRIFLHKIIWKHYAQMLNRFATKFYGVLPARVNFLKNIYGIPNAKVELLVMGGDDELIESAAQESNYEKIRSKYDIKKDDFLIVTGGKIDLAKTQTLLLMQAVKELPQKVKLIVFGSIDQRLKADADRIFDNKKIFYAGWLDSRTSYDFFATADLVVFPGRHSVYWEQVVAQGIPMICKYWEGTTHVDLGGNVVFLHEDSKELLKKEIGSIVENPEKYANMYKIARSEKRNTFLYSTIAKSSIVE